MSFFSRGGGSNNNAHGNGGSSGYGRSESPDMGRGGQRSVSASRAFVSDENLGERIHRPTRGESRFAASGGEGRYAAAAAERRQQQGGHGYGRGHHYDEFEDDRRHEGFNDSQWLEHRTKQVQGETLDTSRRALQKLNAATATAEGNLATLNQQSEQLYTIDKRLDSTEGQIRVNEAKADYLKSLKGFMLFPAIGKNKAKRREEELKRTVEEERVYGRNAREREAEWNERSQRQEEFQRRYYDDHDAPRGGPAPGAYPGGSGQAPRSRAGQYDRMHTTPQGIERDDVEEEIDSNLDGISSGVDRLKMLALSMNDEIASQASQLKRIDDRTESNREHIGRLNNKMDRLVGGRKKQG